MNADADFSHIRLHCSYRMGSFEVSLQKWIEDEMYQDGRTTIYRVTDGQGNKLPIKVIPPQYLEQYGQGQHQPRMIRLLSNSLQSLKQLVGL